MDDLRQRIRYLVKHGGLWDDPIDDVRRCARLAVGLGAVTLIVHLIDLALV